MSETFEIGDIVEIHYLTRERIDRDVGKITKKYNAKLLLIDKTTYEGEVYDGYFIKNPSDEFKKWPTFLLKKVQPKDNKCICDLMSLMQRGCTCGGA